MYCWCLGLLLEVYGREDLGENRGEGGPDNTLFGYSYRSDGVLPMGGLAWSLSRCVACNLPFRYILGYLFSHIVQLEALLLEGILLVLFSQIRG